ncbi:dihydrolipoyl dehydrogenase family protein [Portibacter marinus]|uniref:dihydrolipoyl dehydrogenase family protein n=1 Tax=Portibacter marinus TaxID=2898660 RepID=UPI001F178FAB|nr:NAD(P)/FAD-dependent oxidoreductase [Portibacter marinus]
MSSFDIIVIGSGPAGSTVAKKCATKGKKIAIVDVLFGGTCALRGCTPKKAMESVTSTFWETRDFTGYGFKKTPPFIDWHDLMAHKAKFTSTVPAQTKSDFEERGITAIEGKASFLDKKTLLVDGKEYSADLYVIATGATPRTPPFPGAEHMITSDDFFELDHLPKKVAIVGGGYVGFELSHIMAACGSEVTILSDEEMPLTVFEEDLVRKLIQATLHKGIEVKLGFKVSGISRENDSYLVKASRSSITDYELEADLVLNATGRIPAVSDLNLENVPLELNENQGIKVDRFLFAEGHEHIMAIGDVSANLPFTEVANYEANLAVHNIFEKRRKSVGYHGVPMVIYTYPKMAMVGLKTEECGNMNVKEASLRTSFIQRARANQFAGYKTIVEKSTKKIVGAHIIGYNADEAINIFALAMQLGITCDDLKNSFLAYPTVIHDTKFLV